MKTCICESVLLGENPPITQWSQRPWLILVPVVQCSEWFTSPVTNQLQSCAGLFYMSASQALTIRSLSYNL